MLWHIQVKISSRQQIQTRRDLHIYQMKNVSHCSSTICSLWWPPLCCPPPMYHADLESQMWVITISVKKKKAKCCSAFSKVKKWYEKSVTVAWNITQPTRRYGCSPLSKGQTQSKTPGGSLKPQRMANSIYNFFLCIHTYDKVQILN